MLLALAVNTFTGKSLEENNCAWKINISTEIISAERQNFITQSKSSSRWLKLNKKAKFMWVVVGLGALFLSVRVIR